LAQVARSLGAAASRAEQPAQASRGPVTALARHRLPKIYPPLPAVAALASAADRGEEKPRGMRLFWLCADAERNAAVSCGTRRRQKIFARGQFPIAMGARCC